MCVNGTQAMCSKANALPLSFLFLIQVPKSPKENDIAELLDRVRGQVGGGEGARAGQVTLLQPVKQAASPQNSELHKAVECDIIIFLLQGQGAREM